MGAYADLREETGERMYGYLECPAINGYNPESGVGPHSIRNY